MVETRRAFFFSSLADLHLAFVTRESARLPSTCVRSCSPRESVRVISPEYPSLHVCAFSRSSRFILTESIYRDVLIAIACLIKLRHVHSSPIHFVFEISTATAATMQRAPCGYWKQRR